MLDQSSKNVAVIGAGPAGLAAAYELAKQGVKVEVFEAQDSVGGMAKSINLWGQIVDLGPHRFFSTDTRVNKIWLEVVEGRYEMVERLTRIYYKNKFFDYPLKTLNTLRGLGGIEAIRCAASYVKTIYLPKKDNSTFENWVINRFGRRLFEIFFKSYSEKLWGISCQDLDAEFAAQRIKSLSLFEAVKSAFFHSGHKHKTLVDQFAYPAYGTGYIYEKMAEHIRRLGGQIHLNSRVQKVAFSEGDPSLELKSGELKNYTHVISSMPITALVQRMEPPAEILAYVNKLKFRNTTLVYLEIEGDNHFPDQWIYVHAPNLKMGRITNFRNWVLNLYKNSQNTILCLEYWCYDSEELWKVDDVTLIQLGSDEIKKTGLIVNRPILNNAAIKIPKCYPVYSRGYKKYLTPVENYLSGFEKLSVIGRYGAFKYNNQDHSILMGYLAAQNIATGTKHNLWEINTDYRYQESSLITKSGLKKVGTHD